MSPPKAGFQISSRNLIIKSQYILHVRKLCPARLSCNHSIVSCASAIGSPIPPATPYRFKTCRLFPGSLSVCMVKQYLRKERAKSRFLAGLYQPKPQDQKAPHTLPCRISNTFSNLHARCVIIWMIITLTIILQVCTTRERRCKKIETLHEINFPKHILLQHCPISFVKLLLAQ